MNDFNLRIKEIDARYKGYQHFKYMIVSVHHRPAWGSGIASFNIIRDWCINTWGTSCELNDYGTDNTLGYVFNKHWSWHNDDMARRLYLTGDEELAWFKLAWQ